MNTYKFRAECLADVANFLLEFRPEHTEIVAAKMIPDVECVIKTSADIDKVKGAMADVMDSHVMMQTIQPIDKYTGERK